MIRGAVLGASAAGRAGLTTVNRFWPVSLKNFETDKQSKHLETLLNARNQTQSY
jgi:hypothetical protein